jgi:hypothetical protein
VRPAGPVLVDRLLATWKKLGSIGFAQAKFGSRGVVDIPSKRPIRVRRKIPEYGFDEAVEGWNCHGTLDSVVAEQAREPAGHASPRGPVSTTCSASVLSERRHAGQRNEKKPSNTESPEALVLGGVVYVSEENRHHAIIAAGDCDDDQGFERRPGIPEVPSSPGWVRVASLAMLWA